MGLRLAEGIDAAALAKRFGLETIVNWSAVDRLRDSGHLARTGTRIAATPVGRLVLNRILAEIAAALSAPISAWSSTGSARPRR